MVKIGEIQILSTNKRNHVEYTGVIGEHRQTVFTLKVYKEKLDITISRDERSGEVTIRLKPFLVER